MQYFLMSVDTTDKKWRGREILADSLLTKDGQDVRHQIAYGEGKWNDGQLYCEFLRQGVRAPVQALLTKRIVLFGEPIAVGGLKDLGDQVEVISVLDKCSNRKFYLFHPVATISCVDFERSEIEKWPSNAQLDSWHDPRGRAFVKPCLMEERIPTDLEIFRLADWPGISNIVVTEAVKIVLEKSADINEVLEFVEL